MLRSTASSSQGYSSVDDDVSPPVPSRNAAMNPLADERAPGVSVGDPGQRLEMSTWRAATLQSPAERIVVWVAVSETPAT